MSKVGISNMLTLGPESQYCQVEFLPLQQQQQRTLPPPVSLRSSLSLTFSASVSERYGIDSGH